jgi:hypothetical protein
MSHRLFATTSAFVAALGLAAGAAAQMNPRGETSVTLGGKKVSVEYGRPSLKGRDMLGKAEVGQEWRMGADTATTFKTAGPLSFGATQVPAGDYTLRAKKVSDADWVLKLEKEGGAAIEVPLQSATLPQSVETFTIDLGEDGGQGVFKMSWGTRALSARFTAK